MDTRFKTYVASRLREIISFELEDPHGKHDVFVMLGLADIVDLADYSSFIVDPASFGVDGNDTVFNEDEWFDRIRAGLRKEQDFYIMSYQQFSYYTMYAPNLTKFKERAVIVMDNVRSLFPLKSSEYIEKTGEDNMEQRPESMPVYHSEQVSIEGEAFFSYTVPTEYKMVGFFQKTIPLKMSEEECTDILELDDHMYSLDVVLNRALREPSFKCVLGVKLAKDIVREDEFQRRLWHANGFLDLLGAGKIVLQQERAIDEHYIPKEETVQLLQRYWGDNASFRDIKVYKNPGQSNRLIDISQGQIVDLIIDEYKKSKQGEAVPDDVFITAPTGSGKSLLFQLPAFYVSECGDVTIVVSPLIALMKDQVMAILRDRKFSKVAYLNSDLNLVDRDRIIDQCKNGEIDILYMSPELLLSYDVSFFIGVRRLGLIVIDEAHLITTWGRDFRVDYWHLGNHINKIRKYKEMNFPIVALTATAIYSGPNDMVVDSMGSLYMHNPHLFLGRVKREEIHFVINNYKAFKGGYKKNKLEQTTDFIKEIDKHHIKTVVYAPYATHVNQIIEGVKDIAVGYHGKLSAEHRDFAASQFQSNKKLIMVCTKAFGMGVDYPDIQVVYHHAPSGLLPDYVQEVGRVARKPGMVGFAALNYNEKDKQYSEQLFGMSSIRQWQIREILKKIYSLYCIGGKKRNMLISSDDFSFIFKDGDPEGKKLKTALMMIEKDYLTRARYNVLIARPKQLFVKCYARTDAYGMSVLERRYPGAYTEIRKLGKEQTVVMLNLDEIWKKDFSSVSFGELKREFYNGKLLSRDNAIFVPLSRYTLTLKQDYQTVKDQLFLLLDRLSYAFSSMGYSVFTEQMFIKRMSYDYPDKVFCNQLARYVLSAFSGHMVNEWTIEGNAFLQRREYESTSYKVFNQSYGTIFSNIERFFTSMFEGTDQRSVSRFFSNENDNALTYSRLGSLVELLGLGTFECRGGDNPMVFVRLNDPERIHRDSEYPRFKNELLTRTTKRHEISSEIFDHFFTNTFTSDERWNFIEDFFLGATNEELFEKYTESEDRNYTDIVKYIVDNIEYVKHERIEPEKGTGFGTFPPRKGEKYYKDNLLTIEGRTMQVIEWLNQDPVSLDMIRRKFKLSLESAVFNLLVSKILKNHPSYYKDMMGLNIQIEFKGYDGLIPASVPYTTTPVEFYKWWKKAENNDKVVLSKIDQIKLFIKVNQLEPKALLVKHKEMIMKGK